jgi:phytoene synthase
MERRVNADLQASYALCRRIARRAASSFYLSFFLLPRAQRDAMCALYAFLRRTDDIADAHNSLEQRVLALAAWRQAFELALVGDVREPLLPALIDLIERFSIPLEYFRDAIDGAEMDFTRRRYATFAELEEYCRRAASVVGLACIRIWGCRDERAVEPAHQCGLAFQLTNILRDVAEDARRGRIYLPLEDLACCGCHEGDLLAGRLTDGVRRLIEMEIDRAQGCYDRAGDLEPLLPRDGRRAWRVMLVTYRAILDELRRRGGNVFGPPIRLSRWRRVSLAARALMFARPVRRGDAPSPSLAILDRRSA